MVETSSPSLFEEEEGKREEEEKADKNRMWSDGAGKEDQVRNEGCSSTLQR